MRAAIRALVLKPSPPRNQNAILQASQVAGRSRSKEHWTTGNDQLIAEFVSVASQRGIAAGEGKPQLANKLLARLGKVKKRLESMGEPGRSALLSLLDHPNPWVRLEAASYALKIAETRAKTVLENLRIEPSSVGLMAQALLDLRLKEKMGFKFSRCPRCRALRQAVSSRGSWYCSTCGTLVQTGSEPTGPGREARQ